MSTRPEDVGLSSERLARIDRHLLERLIPSRTFDFRGQLQAIVYGAIEG